MLPHLPFIKTSLLFTLLLLMPQLTFADQGVKKISSSAKTLYIAKSYLEDEDKWDIRWSEHYAMADKFVIYYEQQWDNTESEFSGKVLSIVGPYVSYKISSHGYSQGAAHPWAVSHFDTINISTGKKATLTDIFEAKDIYHALIKDNVIVKALKGATPKNLPELLAKVDGGCDFYFSKKSLSNFAFHHVNKNRVAVRLGLSHGCEVQRGNLTQIGFYLPIPNQLKEQLTRAKANSTLMNTMTKLTYK